MFCKIMRRQQFVFLLCVIGSDTIAEIYITEILDSVIDEKISNKFEATTDREIVGIFMK